MAVSAVRQFQEPRTKSKRTAEDALPSPRSKRACLPTPKFLGSSWSSSRTTTRPADPLSINGLMRKHSRDRLYVPLLHWTSQHLQLLDCQFILEKAGPQQKESSRRRRGRSGNANQGCYTDDKATRNRQQHSEAASLSTEAVIRATADDLRYASTTEFKTSAVRHLLERHGISRFQ